MADLKVTLIQSELAWENRRANLDMFSSKIKSIKDNTEIIILPEMFTTGFSMQPELLAETMDGITVKWMREMAALKKAIITGSLIIEDEGRYYNRLIWMLPNGEYGYYDKRHLFAYANEHMHYTPGKKRLIAQAKGWKINLQVCYDLRFPVWARQAPNSQNNFEYDLLIYVANWPEKRNTAWKTLLQARAIENQCYVIGVNRIGLDGNQIHYSGDSMVIDPLGEIVCLKSGEEEIYSCTLQHEKLKEVRTKFPFWKDADNFYIPE